MRFSSRAFALRVVLLGAVLVTVLAQPMSRDELGRDAIRVVSQRPSP